MRWAALILGTVTLWVLAAAEPALAKSCADFDSQADAQRHLRNNPRDPDNLDPDNNGIACENAPSPQDTTPVRHVSASGSTIPLAQDSPTTSIRGGSPATTNPVSGADDESPESDDATTSTSEFDTTDSTSTLNQQSDSEGVSAAGIVGTVVGFVVFAAVYVWIRRR